METIGVDDPAIQWITNDIKKAVDGHESATPAQIIAALDTYKLEYQLRLFGIIEDETTWEGDMVVLDKYGWPVTRVKGRPILNFFRMLIYGRKIVRKWEQPKYDNSNVSEKYD